MSRRPPRSGSAMSALRRYALTVVLVGVVTAAGLGARRLLADPDLVMLYMLAIAVAAALLGRGPSVLASALAVLAYNFFFVHPLHTLAIADKHYLLTFAMMFVIGLVISGLSLRVRKAQIEELRSALLSTVSHDLRSPLGAITGAATTLRDGAAG